MAVDLRKAFPNATADQLKRLEAGTLTYDALIQAGGGTAQSLKLLYPAATADQLKRLQSGDLTHQALLDAQPKGKGGADTTTAEGGEPLGVMQGGRTIRVRSGGQERYYQIYEFPRGSGQFVSYQFNNRAQAVKALGQDFDVETRTESWFNQRVIAEGQGEEMIGQEGNWNKFMQDLMRDSAVAAGVRDPSLVGRMASNREMQQIMAQAAAGDWTAAQIRAAQRNTNFWKKTLYPGIENLYGMGITNPEAAYGEYMRTVQGSLKALGYKPGPDGTYKNQIAKMLNKKIDADIFLSQVPTFIRATQNKQFATQLQRWAKRDGIRVEFKDWFDLVGGRAQPRLDAVAEKATLAWTAQNQGVNVSAKQISQLAAKSQLSEPEMRQAFSDFNTSLLALGDEALGRYGLKRDEILSVAAGVKPKSGRSIEEVKLLVAKTAREQGLADDEKLNFYMGFTEKGTPIRPGLQSLSPEGA